VHYLVILFILERNCAYCEVETEYLNTVLINFRLKGRDMAQAAGCRPLTSEACVPSRASPREVRVENVPLAQLFLPVILFPPVGTIAPVLHTYLHLHVVLSRRTKGPNLGTLQKIKALSENGEHWIQSYFRFFPSLKG
jgi:hypothetical protein